MAKMVTAKGYTTKEDLVGAVGQRAEIFMTAAVLNDGMYTVTALGDFWTARVTVKGGRIVRVQ
jgi:hypothetical protein